MIERTKLMLGDSIPMNGMAFRGAGDKVGTTVAILGGGRRVDAGATDQGRTEEDGLYRLSSQVKII